MAGLLFQLVVVIWLYSRDQSSQGPKGLLGDTTANTARQPQRLKGKDPQALNFPTKGATAPTVTVPGIPGFANIFHSQFRISSGTNLWAPHPEAPINLCMENKNTTGLIWIL